MKEGETVDVFASATTAISDLTTKAISFVNTNAPVIFTVMGVIAGVTIAFKLFKKFSGKVA